jgi:hypothetical protein
VVARRWRRVVEISRISSEGANNAPRTVRLFLVDGRARGLTVAEMGNWSGKVLSAPRSGMPQLLRRPECARTGVYVLMGSDPERPGRAMAYVGEADDVSKRLRRHLATGDNDFFEQAAVVVASDASLTKAHGRYLEAQLIRATQQAGGVRLFNDKHPDFRGLPEADLVDMDYFLEQLRLVLPLLGFDLYRGLPGSADPGGSSTGDGPLFAFATAGASARGRDNGQGFIVLAGSTARKGSSGTFPTGYRALRDTLVADGKLVDGPSPDLFSFAADVQFSSPSAAASIVAGRSAGGPLEWKLPGSGQTYRDWNADRLGRAG